MPRGGSRKGAGRKVGAANRRTRQIADEAMKQGMSPLEVMLDNMRFAHTGAEHCLERLVTEHEKSPLEMFDAYKEMLKLRAMAQEAAKDGAPYMHPRLAAIGTHWRRRRPDSARDESAERCSGGGGAKGG